MSDNSAWFIAICGFLAGYWIVSALIDRIRKPKAKPIHQASSAPSENPYDVIAKEAHYRSVIGVTSEANEQEIKNAYRQMLAQYHPDKVTHPGTEFQEMASQRTREIVEAYGFLKERHGFR